MQNTDLIEPIKKRVGGNLSRLSPLRRLEMLRNNACLLRGIRWIPPADDGTLVKKVVGVQDKLEAMALRKLQADLRAFD